MSYYEEIKLSVESWGFKMLVVVWRGMGNGGVRVAYLDLDFVVDVFFGHFEGLEGGKLRLALCCGVGLLRFKLLPLETLSRKEVLEVADQGT